MSKWLPPDRSCRQERLDRAIEKLRLVEIGDVPGLRQLHELRAWDRGLQFAHSGRGFSVLGAHKKKHRDFYRAGLRAEVMIGQCGGATDKSVDRRCRNHLTYS